MKKTAIITCIIFMVLSLKSQEAIQMLTHLKSGGIITTLVTEIDTIIFDRISAEESVVINGIRWSTRNVGMPGTFTAGPEDAGMFYQWNRKTGWSSADPMVNSNGFSSWDSSMPTGNSWEKANDPCPPGWRVPTRAELESLISSGSQWTTLNSVPGRFFGSGLQVVFFPAAGYRGGSDGTLNDVGSYGHYWSRTPPPGNSEGAYGMGFNSEDANTNNYWRSNGFSVRCVSE